MPATLFGNPIAATRPKNELYAAFERTALRLIEAGHTHWGAKAIFEVLRFRSAMRGPDNNVKINNNLTSLFARRFVAEHPDHEGFFEIRQRRP